MASNFGSPERLPGCRYKWYAFKGGRNEELICEGFATREECERAALAALQAPPPDGQDVGKVGP